MRRSTATGTQKFATEFQKLCDLMAATRPTAVNLFWAIERMKRSFADAAQRRRSRSMRSSSGSTREAQRDPRRGRRELPRDGRVRRDAGAATTRGS